MKLKTLYERIITEILDFNNIGQYKYTKINNNHYRFEVEDGEIDVTFGSIKFEINHFKSAKLLNKFDGEEIINVGYTFNLSDTQFKRTDLKEFLPILKTIVSIIDEYVEKNKPKLLLILSIDRYGGMSVDKSKDKIYQLLVKKYLPTSYGVSEVQIGNDGGLILYNIQSLKK